VRDRGSLVLVEAPGVNHDPRIPHWDLGLYKGQTIAETCWNNEFIYLIIAPCRCRGLGVRFPSAVIFHGFPTWCRLLVRIDALTLRGQASNPLTANYYLECLM
jgi:hypothetical protein